MKIRNRKLAAAMLVALFVALSLGMSAFSEEAIYAVDTHMIDLSECEAITEEIVDSYGNTYADNIIQFNAGNHGYASFDLNGNYEKLSGAFVTSDNTSSDGEFNIAIFVDGVECFSVDKFTKQSPKQEFDVDLSGAYRIDIKTSDSGYSWGYGWVYLVESEFVKCQEAKEYTVWNTLSDTVVVDSDDFYIDKALSKDSFGNLHNGSIKFDSTLDGFALFNLDKKYTTLSGSIAAGEDTSSDTKMDVKIFCDDQEVFSKQGITRQDPKIDIDLDVTGVSVLRIVSDSEYNGSYEGYIYFYDDILK